MSGAWRAWVVGAIALGASAASMGCSWGMEILPDETPVPVGGDGSGGANLLSGGSGGFGGAVPGAECGDGNVEADEVCDDGGESDACDVDCSEVECGDGVLNESAGEECEPAGTPYCKSDCTPDYASSIVNRFSFEGTGTAIVDTVGSGSGSLFGTTLDGSGSMTIVSAEPPSQQYALLGSGLVSSHTNATFEVWVTWNGAGAWHRIFDFGNSTNGVGQQGLGASYFFLTPLGLDDTGGLRATFSTNEIPEEVYVEAEDPLPVGVMKHVAVVVNDDADLLQLYVDGQFEVEAPFSFSLSQLDDVNAWLGLSQFAWDPEFDGVIDELRIYDVALTPEEIERSFEVGPDI